MIQRIILLFFVANLCLFANAQNDSVRVSKKQALVLPDSVFIPNDDTIIVIPSGVDYEVFNSRRLLSKYFYDSVYAAAQKSRITKELYNLLITNRPYEKKEIKKDPQKSESYFEAYKGKYISKIKFTAVDLFSGSVSDTTHHSESSLVKLCNQMHHNTRSSVVAKHLLFEKGDKLDPFDIADTERVIRSLSFIEDAKITVKIDQDNVDNVVVIVITKDRFPWTGDLDVDSNEGAILQFTNKNILGTGNELASSYWHSFDNDPIHGFDAQYRIRNIWNSFIDGRVFLSNNYEGKSKGIGFRRGFISPKIKYFGAATLEHVQPIQDLVFADSIYQANSDIDRKSYDIWGARTFQIGTRRTISLALRLDHDKFHRRPEVKADSNIMFHNHHLLLGALTYSRINFLKTKKIQSFNITEDIPIGFIYSILIGKDWTEFGVRNYRGFKTSYSAYSSELGYGLINFESGYFQFPDAKTNQIYKFDLRHFTPLFSLGKADARIFSRFSFFDGDQLSVPISQSLSGENRISSITGDQINGNRLVSFSSELVAFQPWYFYGFKFALLANAGVGYVRENRLSSPYEQTFFNFGTGIRIQNESLVINTFEMRLSLFPNPPPNSDKLRLKITLAAPSFFQNLNIGKPKLVGIE